jgi:hypothetical protein
MRSKDLLHEGALRALPSISPTLFNYIEFTINGCPIQIGSRFILTTIKGYILYTTYSKEWLYGSTTLQTLKALK